MVRQPQPNKQLYFQLNKQVSQGLQLLLIWGLVLLVTGVLAWQAWAEVTAVDYRVQDDARQHIFWMLRYLDPTLFPNDPIADYFQAMAPWLYRSLYAAGWQILGLTPLDLALGLSPVLGLIAVGYAVAIGRHLSLLPWASGLAGILCAQTLWMEDDLVSATPRAFATPLLLAFLFYVLRRNPWGCGLTIVMQAGLYPPAALMSWLTTSLRLGDRRNWPVWVVSTIALGLGLLPLLLRPESFGPMITGQEARSMLEFQAIGDTYGRAFFFHDNPLIFWGFSPRSGFLFWGLMAPLNIAVLGWGWMQRQYPSLRASFGPIQDEGINLRQETSVIEEARSQEPGARRALDSDFGFRTPRLAKIFPLKWVSEAWRSPDIREQSPFAQSPLHADSRILWQFSIAVILLYGIAHLALFKLHFPARYPYHGFRTVLPIAAAIVLAETVRWQIRHWQTYVKWTHRLPNLALASLQIALLLLPFYPELSLSNQLYTTGRSTDLYELLQNTPQDTLVATLDKEGNNLPMFAARSTFVGGEYTLPYHLDYYSLLRQRAKDLLAAYVAATPEPLTHLLERYPITYLLLHEDSFTTEYLYTRTWLYPFQPEFNRAVEQLEVQQEVGEKPFLERLLPTCTVQEKRNLLLIDANCIRDQLKTLS
ncbi:MAG: hypothetical protein AAGE59_07070 [Cyanobacteria bacterium P01_F01_bin.86]